MSDQRFDQDLRSVLLEDAPQDVPDDLRNRVAAVPMTHAAASRLSGPAWRRPVLLWIGALAVFVVALAFASGRFPPTSQPGFGGAPSLTPAVAPSPTSSIGAIASPSPTSSIGAIASPSPKSSIGAIGSCRGVDVQGLILRWEGAAGSRIADVQLTNTTTHTCQVRGTPGLQLVDAGGRVLIDSATAGPSGQPHVTRADATFELAPGDQLRTQVQAANYCGPAPSLPIDIAIALPSGGEPFVAAPGAGVSSADAVPGCLGSAGSQITMNGWRRP